jgi:hypothetical protein
LKKSIEELQKNAVRWWPDEILETAALVSPAVLIKNSHPEFLRTLANLPVNVSEIPEALRNTKMPFNLFLKHLLILADFGGEQVKRVHLDRKELFGDDKDFKISIDGTEYLISIDKFISSKSVTNASLKIDGQSVSKSFTASQLQVDLAQIVLFGNFSVSTALATTLSSCDLFKFAQHETELRDFISTRYLEVSRIGRGADANALGQALQIEVDKRLRLLLGSEYEIMQNGRLTVKGHTMTSDLLIVHNQKSVAIEVAFQVTTNSTIERKATDAAKRMDDLNQEGIASCYVLDGIGIFERRSALNKILDQSNLVVNFSTEDTRKLADFIRNWCK